MEASSRDRSSRLDASAASHAQDRRRTLKSSGSGRRRRRPSVEVERMPDTSSGVLEGSRMDASAYNRGSRSRMDNSSAYSSSGGGGSHRREYNLQQLRDQSAAAAGNASGASGMDLSSAQNHSYAQKYKAAQKLLEEHHHKSTPPTTRRHNSRRRSSTGASSGTSDTSNSYSQLGYNNNEGSQGSRSPSDKRVKQRHLSDKYKLIGRVGGRRQSMDSAVTMDSNNDVSVKSQSPPGSSTGGGGHLRTRGVPPRSSSKGGAEKSLTATRLKKVFSPDAAPATPGRVGNKSPARGVRRQASLPTSNNKGPPSRRIVERKTSGTGSTLSNSNNHASRRSSLPSNGSASEESSSGLKKQQHQHRRHTRHPKDFAYKTTYTPKLTKPKASMDAQAVLDSSMPSLTALDLSVHKHHGKRISDGSVFTTDDDLTRDSMSVDKARPLIKAGSISLLVDNAQSHASTRNVGGTFKDEGDEDDLEEASTIANSVDDVYASAIASVDTSDPANGSRGMEMSRSDQSSRMDISRSDGSNSQGPSHSRLDGSRMDASRMEASSRIGNSRRRTNSHDDSGNAPSRRKRSPRDKRSRSRGAQNKDRKDSNRNLRVRSTSSEKKPARRASMAGRVSREHRGTSSSSLVKDKEMQEFGHNSNSSLLRRSKTTSAVPKKQKSSNSLQRNHTSESPGPRRQRSVSSLKSAGSNSKTSAVKRKSKKAKAKSMLASSLGELETMWVRGSAEIKEELQAAANTALAEIAAVAAAEKGNNNNNKPNRRRSSAASVGSNSMESRSSRRSLGSSGRRRGPPRRSMSSGSASIASYGSAAGKRKERMRRTASSKDVPDQRESDGTWSLADIDLGEDSPSKADPDASVVTPATVSSSSAEGQAEQAPRRKRGLRRSQSTGSNYVSGGDGKSRKQPSQKSLSTTAPKVQTSKSADDLPGVPELKAKKSKDKFHQSADHLEIVKTNVKQGDTVQRSGKQNKGPGGDGSKDTPFASTNGQFHRDPFHMNAARLDPFRNQGEEDEKGDPFESSLHDPFASNDPFGLSKPPQVNKGKTLGQPKPNDDMTNDSTHSFHMTNDFGDFGHESFGSVSFDNSQDFAVVPAEKASAKSLLG